MGQMKWTKGFKDPRGRGFIGFGIWGQCLMLIVADNLNVMHPVIARALERLDPEPIRRLVQRCVDAGAQALDINTGPLQRRPLEKMTFLVETVQSVTDLPLVLDTVNPEAMQAGLAACAGPVTINGFSLEPVKLELA